MLCMAMGSWWELTRHNPGIATSLIVRQNASEMVSEDGKGLKPLSQGKTVFCVNFMVSKVWPTSAYERMVHLGPQR